MSSQYLLDTNVLSEPIKQKPNVQVLDYIQKHEGKLSTASIVVHEMMFGCHRLPFSHKRQTIQNYLQNICSVINILPYDLKAATWHARERARLSNLGISTPFADGQIAAIAKVNSLVLITRNVNDFKYFDDLEVENWFL